MGTISILHGGFTHDSNDLNSSYYQKITKNLKDGDGVLVVLFSRKDEKYAELFQNEVEKIKASTNRRLNIMLASEDNFIDQIKQSSAVVIRGGETTKLLEAVKKYPDFTEAIKGKIIGGSSAGAYLFARFYHSADHGTISEGLGILPIRVICHYESKTYPKVRQNAIDQMNQYSKELELIVLRDYEWKTFQI